MNLVMCDKKCRHQKDGYCMVTECKINSTDEKCPHFEAEKEEKQILEFPEPNTPQEIPAFDKDMPTLPPQKPLLY